MNATNVNGSITLSGDKTSGSGNTTYTLSGPIGTVTASGTSAESKDVTVEGKVITIKDNATSVDATITFSITVGTEKVTGFSLQETPSSVCVVRVPSAVSE